MPRARLIKENTKQRVTPPVSQRKRSSRLNMDVNRSKICRQSRGFRYVDSGSALLLRAEPE